MKSKITQSFWFGRGVITGDMTFTGATINDRMPKITTIWNLPCVPANDWGSHA